MSAFPIRATISPSPVPRMSSRNWLLDAERAPGEFDLRFAFALDGLRRVPDQTQHMLGMRKASRSWPRRWHSGMSGGGGEHGGPTETMTEPGIAGAR